MKKVLTVLCMGLVLCGCGINIEEGEPEIKSATLHAEMNGKEISTKDEDLSWVSDEYLEEIESNSKTNSYFGD